MAIIQPSIIWWLATHINLTIESVLAFMILNQRHKAFFIIKSIWLIWNSNKDIFEYLIDHFKYGKAIMKEASELLGKK